MQLHGGSLGFNQGGSTARPPSSVYGSRPPQQPQGGAGNQQGQANDFMSQLRAFMSQYQQPSQPNQQGQQQQRGFQFPRNNLPGLTGGQGGPGVSAGDFLSEAIANDYANRTQDQQRMAAGFDGLIRGVQQIPMMGLMGLGQTMQMNQQGADMAREGVAHEGGIVGLRPPRDRNVPGLSRDLACVIAMVQGRQQLARGGCFASGST
jgi:hypothetical protein